MDVRVLEWFFGSVSAAPLGIFRIAFGIVLLLNFLTDFSKVRWYYSGEGFLPADYIPVVLRPLHFSVFDWIESTAAVYAVYFLLLFVILLFIIGWKTKYVSIVQFLLILSFHERNILVLNSGDTLLRTLSLLIIFVPLGAAYSIDSWKGKAERWQLLLLQLQVVMVYVFAGLAKWGTSAWMSGQATERIFRNNLWNRIDMDWISAYPEINALMAFGGIATMLLFPILIWIPQTRRVALLMGIMFHGMIMLIIDVGWFSLIILSAYALFLKESEAEWLANKVKLKKIKASLT